MEMEEDRDVGVNDLAVRTDDRKRKMEDPIGRERSDLFRERDERVLRSWEAV